MKSGMFNMIFKNRIHSDIVTEMGVPVYILLLQLINTLKTLTRIIANTFQSREIMNYIMIGNIKPFGVYCRK